MPSVAKGRAPFWLLLGGTVVLDRVTKVMAEGALGNGESIALVGDIVRFQLVHNRGAAFGIGSVLGGYSRWIFLTVAIIAVPVLYRLWREAPLADRLRQYALGFVAGGAIGNGIDRILSARGVTDFVDIGISSTLRWPTFNVADIAVSCGAVVLAICLWREDATKEVVKVPPTPV